MPQAIRGRSLDEAIADRTALCNELEILRRLRHPNMRPKIQRHICLALCAILRARAGSLVVYATYISIT